MIVEDKKQTFRYSYSAKEQEELRKIRQKYLPRDEDKMEQLRRLDQSVTRKGTAVALFVGIIGCLVLGVGMCCTMVWADTLFIPGIIVGIVGIAGFRRPIRCMRISPKKQKEKLAPEILRLTEELMK